MEQQQKMKWVWKEEKMERRDLIIWLGFIFSLIFLFLIKNQQARSSNVKWAWCIQVCISKKMDFPFPLKVFSSQQAAVWAAVEMWEKVLYIKNDNFALCLRTRQLAFSPGLVLEKAVCKRASGVAWFSCVGASLNPAGGCFKPPHLPTAQRMWLEDKKQEVMMWFFPKYLKANPVEHPLVSF